MSDQRPDKIVFGHTVQYTWKDNGEDRRCHMCALHVGGVGCLAKWADIRCPGFDRYYKAFNDEARDDIRWLLLEERSKQEKKEQQDEKMWAKHRASKAAAKKEVDDWWREKLKRRDEEEDEDEVICSGPCFRSNGLHEATRPKNNRH
jgi:hypothetical protein